MSKSNRDRREAKKEQKRHTALVARARVERALTDYTRWPVVSAYVPMDDCFRATGCGSAGIVRRRPDGKLISAFFDIQLMNGGIINMFGKDDHANEAEVDKLLADLGPLMPPLTSGTEELVSRYAWGAYAWSLNDGYGFPEEGVRRYLHLVPRLSGTRGWWLQQMSGTHGLIPQELADVIYDNRPEKEIPENKEIMIFTTATFDLNGRQEAVGQIQRQTPDFTAIEGPDDRVMFDFSREYPKNHWSPLRLLGGRQSLGSVVIDRDSLIGECKTLSMMARLITRLKALLGDSIRLRDTEWKGAQELLREARQSDDLLDIDPTHPAA